MYECVCACMCVCVCVCVLVIVDVCVSLARVPMRVAYVPARFHVDGICLFGRGGGGGGRGV